MSDILNSKISIATCVNGICQNVYNSKKNKVTFQSLFHIYRVDTDCGCYDDGHSTIQCVKKSTII